MCAVCVVCLVCLVCVLMYKKKKGKAVDPEKLCLCMPTLIRKLVTSNRSSEMFRTQRTHPGIGT